MMIRSIIRINGHSVEYPPKIQQSAVLISLAWVVVITARPLGCLALHKTLWIAVFRIFDIFSGMEKGSSFEVGIYVARMRDIFQGNDFQKSVIFPISAFAPALSAVYVRFPTIGMLYQRNVKCFVQFCL